MRGEDGDDEILGGNSDDRMFGQNGNDRIASVLGYDVANGGNHEDTCVADRVINCEN